MVNVTTSLYDTVSFLLFSNKTSPGPHSNKGESQGKKVVYYESIKRELKIRPIYECRCDETLQTKTKEFTLLSYTGLIGGQEHLKIETSLINEKIENALGEYVT